jgi:O-antigen ligase
MLAAISIALVATNWRRFSVPLHVAGLLSFVAFAGLSVTWAFRPELSAIRYAQQVMIVTCVVLPALIVTGRGDLLRGLFLCFAVASVINAFFVLGPPPTLAAQATPGHVGYFQGKNYLGLCGAITLLLSVHEMMHRGRRRWWGLVVGVIALVLLYLSNAKTSSGLALLSPILAGVALLARRTLRVSPWAIPLSILVAYLVVSTVLAFDVYKLSYWIYGESTFTGRRFLWSFAQQHISQRPLLGWGYQSFWLVGPDAPSVTAATGWIKTMPNAHNGYLDTALEMGYVGLILLLMFAAMTLHAAGHLIDRSPTRAWIVMTLAFFIMLTNFFESMWMRAFEFPWVVFLILAAEVARHLQLHRVAGPQHPTPVVAVKARQRAVGARATPTRGQLRPGRAVQSEATG